MSKKNLVIVESPAKAKTIEKFLGKDFEVKSSFGHIRDLPKKNISIDIKDNFKPEYEIPSEKKKVVSELKKAAKDADTIWLASDEDREGEAIAWHLSEALKLEPKKTKRIVFHEITEPAIKAAIKNPREVDINLVNAQQARRVLDRLVGYELSPILWRKVQRGLSAGRVQSVAVRLIVEREREIHNFEAKSSFKIKTIFKAGNEEIEAELDNRPDNQDLARQILEACQKSQFKVDDIKKKPSKRNPSAPFTTSTLQQEASRKLGFSVKQTMNLAQRLYESGHITYMRTDSTNVSKIALAQTAEYIKKTYGEDYLQVKQFKTKNSSAQEAHEAIRPTNVTKKDLGAEPAQQKLYNLIWRRMVASQMSPASTEKTEIIINLDGRTESFVAKGEILIFAGFLEVYGGGREDSLLPPIKIGQKLELSSAEAREIFSRAPARFTEASLVKALEELGIGRPSTYAPTISTILNRGYIEKVDIEGIEKDVRVISLTDKGVSEETETETSAVDKSKLIPTHLADVTTDFLVKYFSEVVNSSFTAQAEKQLDSIAEGKLVWQDSLAQFYKTFHPLIETAKEASRSEANQSRVLGDDPKTKKPVIARYGRFGLMLQIGEATEEEKPRFAPFPNGARLDTITLDEALEMFKLPRVVGTTKDGKEILANIGRFGPYIQVEKTYVSIKPLDPFEITEEEAREKYQEKLELEANREIKDLGEEIKVLRGPYGPYLSNGKVNARIPKAIEPEKITLLEAKELIAKAKPGKKRVSRRTSKKTRK